MSRFDLTPADVEALRHPVLTIHGTKDRNAPYGAGREWARNLPNARLLTAEGAAHQVWVDRPEVLAQIREFLEGL
jgi:pimeloyl-ACP methyl ester carboxylesterase